MSSKTEDALNDIAFMKALAEDGQRPAPDGGLVTFMAGLLFGGASLFCWTVQTGLVSVPWNTVNLTWTGAALAFAVILVITFLRRGPRNKRSSSQWTASLGMSIAIYTLGFAFSFAMYKVRQPVVMELFSATVFAIYGAYWAVASAVTERAWYRWVSGVSFVSVVMIALLINTPHVYLANAVALFLVACVPGIVLMRTQAAARA
ncbi:hypothetical protein BH11PSE2_BH11PSE2_06610 [soil metagenome]